MMLLLSPSHLIASHLLALMLPGVQGFQTAASHYIRVKKVLIANEETVVPLPYLNYGQCARQCHEMRDTCQGFNLLDNEMYPCVLMQGGLKERPGEYDQKVAAFVDTYFKGRRHFFAVLSISWNEALSLCQSMGMVMVSYPKTDEERYWMNALNERRLFIGAKKDPANLSRIYDINTNEDLVVDWGSDAGEDVRNAVTLVDTSFAFYHTKDNYKWNVSSVLCAAPN